MKKIFIFVSLTLMWCSNAFSQLTITSGTAFTTKGDVHIIVSDLDVNNAGKINAPGSTFHFTGTGNNAITGNGNTITFKNITINKTAGKQLTLNGPLNVTGTVNFISGNIELNNQVINLDSTGSFVGESKTSRATGINGGSIQAFAILNAPTALNIGNLGAIISSSKNLGTVQVSRRHKSVNIITAGGKSICRSFAISTTGASIDGILKFNYFDAELNGLSENNLSQYKSTDGITYADMKFLTRDPAANFVTQTGYVNLNGMYTLTSSNSASPHILKSADDEFSNLIKDKAGYRVSAKFSVAPNPVSSLARVIISSDTAGEGILKLYNANNQQILQHAITLNPGINYYEINMTSLPGGMYNVLFAQSGLPTQNFRLIKL